MNRLLICLALVLGGCATGRDPAVLPSAVPASEARVSASPEMTARLPGSADTIPSPAEAAVKPTEPPPTPERPLTYSELAAANDERLLDIVTGMARADVDRIMDLRRDGRPLNPARLETLRDRNGRVYQVLFYLTREPVAGRPVRENLMTPVIFQNDKVVGIGRYPLKKLRNLACAAGASGQNCGPPKP